MNSVFVALGTTKEERLSWAIELEEVKAGIKEIKDGMGRPVMVNGQVALDTSVIDHKLKSRIKSEVIPYLDQCGPHINALARKCMEGQAPVQHDFTSAPEEFAPESDYPVTVADAFTPPPTPDIIPEPEAEDDLPF